MKFQERFLIFRDGETPPHSRNSESAEQLEFQMEELRETSFELSALLNRNIGANFKAANSESDQLYLEEMKNIGEIVFKVLRPYLEKKVREGYRLVTENSDGLFLSWSKGDKRITEMNPAFEDPKYKDLLNDEAIRKIQDFNEEHLDLGIQRKVEEFLRSEVFPAIKKFRPKITTEEFHKSFMVREEIRPIIQNAYKNNGSYKIADGEKMFTLKTTDERLVPLYYFLLEDYDEKLNLNVFGAKLTSDQISKTEFKEDYEYFNTLQYEGWTSEGLYAGMQGLSKRSPKLKPMADMLINLHKMSLQERGQPDKETMNAFLRTFYEDRTKYRLMPNKSAYEKVAYDHLRKYEIMLIGDIMREYDRYYYEGPVEWSNDDDEYIK